MIADYMSKPIQGVKFEQFRKYILHDSHTTLTF